MFSLIARVRKPLLLAAIAVAAIPASALPVLNGRTLSINYSARHDETAGIDNKDVLKIETQDAAGKFTGKLTDRWGATFNVTGQMGATNSWEDYTFAFSYSPSLGKKISFQGALFQPTPITANHRPALFAAGLMTTTQFINRQTTVIGPSPASLTASEYYSYTYPSGGGTIDIDPDLVVSR